MVPFTCFHLYTTPISPLSSLINIAVCLIKEDKLVWARLSPLGKDLREEMIGYLNKMKFLNFCLLPMTTVDSRCYVSLKLVSLYLGISPIRNVRVAQSALYAS